MIILFFGNLVFIQNLNYCIMHLRNNLSYIGFNFKYFDFPLIFLSNERCNISFVGLQKGQVRLDLRPCKRLRWMG